MSKQKKEEYMNSIKVQQAEYNSHCAKLGIVGGSETPLEIQVSGLIAKLPEHF